MRIAIFGTVGAGKTTLIENLLKRLPDTYQVFLEPMDENPYFKDFYNEGAANDESLNYKMEIWMLASRMGSLVESIGQEDVLFDRGVADTLIFADANHELGKINDLDYKVYKDYFTSCVAPTIFDERNKLYDAVVYLRVNDETSIEHIKKRGNIAEQQVDVNYWKMINKKYEYWFNEWKTLTKFYVIDGNDRSAEEICDQMMEQLGLKSTD